MAELAGLKLENKPWPGGTHSLRYHYLALSEPGPGLPQFLAVGYVNDQPFIRYDSRVGRAEPQAPWIAPMDAHYWEMETQKQKAWAEVQQVEMWTVMGYYNQSGASSLHSSELTPRARAADVPREAQLLHTAPSHLGPGSHRTQRPQRPGVKHRDWEGTHSAQRMFGCEIQEDGRSSSFWQFGFDGKDHLSLDLETLSWVSAEPMAVRTKRWWESERCYAEYDKAYLEGLCLASLRRYLELGGQSLTRREPPTVQVTRHMIQGRGTTLRCWARGFYPQDISLSWWLGEEELALETEHVETRPSGDSTYQTWAAVWVQAGEEAGYSCRVQHSGLNHTLTVAWEPPPRQALVAVVTCTILLVVGVVILTTTTCLRARNTESYKQAPGGEGPP